MPDAARTGGRGRKLHAPSGRFDTRANISLIRRCWMLVSWGDWSAMACLGLARYGTYQLRVEFRQPRLPLAIEDQYSVYHGRRAFANMEI